MSMAAQYSQTSGAFAPDPVNRSKVAVGHPMKSTIVAVVVACSLVAPGTSSAKGSGGGHGSGGHGSGGHASGGHASGGHASGGHASGAKQGGAGRSRIG